MRISLVATSHGTDVPAAREAISALVDAVQEASPHLDVREAFVDVQLPRVDAVVDQVDGLAVVVPLLLAPGFHVRVDVREAADRPWAVAAGTLGVDDRLVGQLVRRLAEAGATRDDDVVMAAAGSTDVRAHRSVETTARLLAGEWGAPVQVGYVGGDGPRVADVVREVRRTPGRTSARRVVVASYLVAPGFFHDRLARSGADVVARPLLDGRAVDPAMVSLVLDRFAVAAHRLDWSAAVPSRCPDLRARQM